MRFSIILFLSIFSVCCQKPTKQSDKGGVKNNSIGIKSFNRLDFIKSRLDEYKFMVDSAKRVGADSSEIAILTTMVDFLTLEYEKIKSEK